MAQEISSFNDPMVLGCRCCNRENNRFLGFIQEIGNIDEYVCCRQIFPNAYHLCNLYEIKFESATVIAVLDEAKVLESVYTNSEVYSRIGKEMCIVIDIAMAKGGTEAIIESFYSSMASQAMHGGQSNETLALRLVAYESGRNKHVNWLKYVRKF